MSFQSRFDGKCKTCKKAYVAGTIIYKINEVYWCCDENCGSHPGFTTPAITPGIPELEIATPPAQLWEEIKLDEEKKAHAAAYSDYDVEATKEQEEDTTALVGQMSQEDWQKLKKQAQKTQADTGNELSRISKRLTTAAVAAAKQQNDEKPVPRTEVTAYESLLKLQQKHELKKARIAKERAAYVSRLHDEMWDLANTKIRDLNIPDSEKVSKSILTQVFYKKMMDSAIHRKVKWP